MTLHITSCEREDDEHTALLRADKLIRWMSGYIRHMAPGIYSTCYADLNAHGCFMDKYRAEKGT